ncbi:MAG TPA: DUF5710 domain-containing protein [Pedobacter sp.]|nr:DUF5710 domain-containing protein [Pedobacter sp.]
MPIKLNVPYAERLQPKALGAWWQPDLKSWVIPDHVSNIDPFERWIPYLSGCIVRKPYLLATAEIKCWKCHKKIPVIALGAKRYFTDVYLQDEQDQEESPDVADSALTNGFWKLSNEPTLFSYPVKLETGVEGYLKKHCPFYKYVYSKTAEQSFWANTCKHCGILQSTNAQHDEPGGVFCPLPLSYNPNPVPVQFSEMDLAMDYHIEADYGGMGYDDLKFP